MLRGNLTFCSERGDFPRPFFPPVLVVLLFVSADYFLCRQLYLSVLYENISFNLPSHSASFPVKINHLFFLSQVRYKKFLEVKYGNNSLPFLFYFSAEAYKQFCYNFRFSFLFQTKWEENKENGSLSLRNNYSILIVSFLSLRPSVKHFWKEQKELTRNRCRKMTSLTSRCSKRRSGHTSITLIT